MSLSWKINLEIIPCNTTFQTIGLYGQNGVLPAKLALREGEIFSYMAVSFVNCTCYLAARN